MWLALLPIVVQSSTYAGCEHFPGFGSALDNVVLTTAGRFNITTHDYLYSRSCSNASKADLVWGHAGSFVEQDFRNQTRFAFTRDELWLEAHTRSGQAFGRALCPHVSLPLGRRTIVLLQEIGSLCASLTFNNCRVYYDALKFTDGGLVRSSAPSCSNTSFPKADGPLLKEALLPQTVLD